MSLATREDSRTVPRLRLVSGSFRQVVAPAEWQRVARAVLACTHELSRHLTEQRWARVAEVVRERRELLFGMEAMSLDVQGRRCLQALTQATEESEAAIQAMCGRQSLNGPVPR